MCETELEESNILDFDFLDDILLDVLKTGDTLATPKEFQMLVDMAGICIGKKPRRDGRYQGYVICPDGNKQYFYGGTRQDVAHKIKAFLQEAKTRKKTKQKKEKYSPTFSEYMEKWIEIYKKPNLKPSSLASINIALRVANQNFGARKLSSISGDDVQELLLSIKAERVRSMCKIYLNQIFKKALVQGIIKRNPCDVVELKRHKSKHRNALTRSEQQIVLQAAKETKYDTLIRLLLSTGLRIGEALALLRSDVDFEKCTVTVSKNVVFVGGKRIEQDTPKSDAGNRTVPISKELCDELSKIETDRLFPYSYNAVKLSVDRIAKNTGICVTLHVLRHTYATRLEEAGIPAKVKQYLLGHATLEMTQNVYTDMQPEYIDSISHRIRECFDT